MSARPAPTPHVPERSCVACRRRRPQAELIRLARTPAGWALQGGARTGRGAYVCADSPACWQEKRLQRAFRGQAAEVARRLAGQGTPPASESHHRETFMQAP